MQLFLSEKSSEFEKGFRELLRLREDLFCESARESVEVELCLEDTDMKQIRVEYKPGKASIFAGKKVFLFRGVITLVRELEKRGVNCEFLSREEVLVWSNGAMVDCSRNSVLQVETVKQFLRVQASLGMSTLMLYTEDTYEVKEYPYFGAYRGNFSQEELREIDAYATNLGVEVVPCIQALAHLSTVLRWPEMLQLRDTEDILLTDIEETYALIRACIKSVTECFSTKRIHLGMDEAWLLGLGNYLHKNGYHSKSEIMSKHLEKVVEICREYDLQPMIWSDMYFRMISSANEYYDVPFDADLKNAVKPSKNVTLVYWDYYHDNSDFYENYILMHQQLSENMILAGGIWTWNGVSPNYTMAWNVSKAAFTAAKKTGLSEIFCTMWQDDGAETPIFSALPALVMYAERGFERVEDSGKADVEDRIAEQFTFLTGWDYKTFWLLNRMDCVDEEATFREAYCDNPSKFLLYQDPLTGMFDGQIEKLSMKKWYETLVREMQHSNERAKETQMGGKTPELWNRMGRILDYYETLAKVLALKAELGLQIRAEYHAGDREGLQTLAEKTIPECIILVEQAECKRREIWMEESRIFGYEVLDIRFAGVVARLKNAKLRIEAYLDGKEKHLPELEHEMLVIRPPKEGEERLLCSANAWRHIVTAGNI